MRRGRRVTLTTDYNWIGKILYLLGNEGIEPEASDYTDRVSLTLTLPAEDCDRLRKQMTEVTNGRVEIVLGDTYYFVDKEDGES